MTTREKYQAYLDAAYLFAPFRVVHTHDLKHFQGLDVPHACQVCSNRRLRYICECVDKDGKTWYIGMDCHTHLEERYEEEHK